MIRTGSATVTNGSGLGLPLIDLRNVCVIDTSLVCHPLDPAGHYFVRLTVIRPVRWQAGGRDRIEACRVCFMTSLVCHRAARLAITLFVLQRFET